MGIRDSELKRLENYGKSLGITITLDSVSKNSPDDGYFAVISKKPYIHIFRNNHTSKIEVILTLLHELAHYLSWVYRGRKNSKKINQALEAMAKPNQVPKNLRKIIYDLEVSDSEYQDLIVKELNLKIDNSIHAKQKELDKWMYYYFYENGTFPEQEEINNKRAAIYAKEERKKFRRILSRKAARSAKTNTTARKKLKKLGQKTNKRGV
jgi:predicted SprT family Zn-dependent metalloprotease